MYKDEIQGGGLSVLNLPMLSKFRCKGFLPAQIPVNAPFYTYVYTGLPTKNETLETTVENLFSLIFLHGSLQLTRQLRHRHVKSVKMFSGYGFLQL